MYHRSRKRLNKAGSYRPSCILSNLLHPKYAGERWAPEEAAIAWLWLLSNNSSFPQGVCIQAVAVLLFSDRFRLLPRSKFLSGAAGRYAT